MNDYIAEYAKIIKSEPATHGKWIELLYDYVLKGLEDGDFFLDEQKADKAINWIEDHCFHTEGPLAPGPFRLELWQKAFLTCVFGLVDGEGRRQFREIVLVVGRKNGKSILASAVANYVFREEGGFGTRVYNIAPKLDQADIIYSNTWAMIQLDPEWQNLRDEIINSGDGHTRRSVSDDMLVKKRQRDMYIGGANSTMQKIAFSAKKSDGFNPSLCICDEIASWEGDAGLKQYEVMKSGMGARPEAMLLSCTTSGYINDSIYDEMVKRSTRFLLGDSQERKLLPFLYMIDDIDKWADLDELRKANPNIGVSITGDYLTEEIAVANGSLSKKAEFMTKYCNIKQNSSQAWLDFKTVDACCGPELSLEDFRGSYCVGGIDLSQTTDMTSCCIIIEKNGTLYVFSKFYIPENRLEDLQAYDGAPYDIFRKRGLLSLSGENYINYQDCYNWFVSLIEQYEIYPLYIGYDRYSAQYLVDELKNYGFHCDDVRQGFNLTPVIREFEGQIKDGAYNIGNNDLLKSHLLNTALKADVESQKVRIVKLRQNTRIDGTAALLDAACVRQARYAEIGNQLRNE